MRILVTGAGGFVGQHLVKGLLREGYQVIALVHKRDLKVRDARLIQVQGDLLRAGTLQDKLGGVEVVFHLVGLYRGLAADLIRANTLTTINLLQEALKTGVKKFIYAAAGAAYGEPINRDPFTEKTPLRPDTIYGLTKMWGEEAVDYFVRVHGLTGINLRFPNIYGPGNTANVIFKFLQSLQKQGKVTVFGNGKQERDFLYVDDAVQGFLKALDYPKSNAFNLSSGKTASLLIIIALLEQMLGKEIAVEFEEAEKGVVEKLWVDSSKAQQLLKWQPKVDLKDGLRETVRWYQEIYGKI